MRLAKPLLTGALAMTQLDKHSTCELAKKVRAIVTKTANVLSSIATPRNRHN
jgi:hypothetical protein